MNKIFTLLIVTFFSSCVSVQKYNAHIDKKIDVDKLQQDVDYTKEKLLTKHVDIDLYHSKQIIANRLDSFKNSIHQPMLPNDFSREFSKVISSFGHGHTTLSMLRKRTEKAEAKKYKKTKSPFSLIELKTLDGRLFFEKNKNIKDSSLIKQGEILAINGISYQDFRKDNIGVRKGDGFITSLDEYLLPVYYTAKLRNVIGNTDSITLSLVKNDSIFTEIVRREYPKKKGKNLRDEKKVDVVKSEDKKTEKKKLTKEEKLLAKKRYKHKEDIKKYFGYNKSRNDYQRELIFPNPEDSTTLVLKIKSFSIGHGKEAYPFIFDSIERLKVKNLVLDIRNNTGGYVSDINYLYSFLKANDEVKMAISNEVKVGSKFTMINKYFNKPNVIGHTFGLPLVLYGSVKSLFDIKKENNDYFLNTKKKKYAINPDKKYKGNLYVLTNGMSYSASSIISASIQNDGKAIFVGEETGGDYNGTVAGQFIDYKLSESKLKLHVGLMTYRPNTSRELKGRGIIPDIPIKMSFEDLINKKDPQLDWILNDIKAKQ